MTETVSDFAECWGLPQPVLWTAARRSADPRRDRALRAVSRALGAGERPPRDSCAVEFLAAVARDPVLVGAAERALDGWRAQGISVTALGDSDYPPLLASIADPPLLLFSRGSGMPELGRRPCIGIVGSRRGDLAACSFAAELGRSLARAGACVVSGLALGVDGAAHRGAVGAEAAALPTAAVLGSGPLPVHPQTHEQLAERIIEAGGIVLSEYEPRARVLPTNFVARNRIIAGLCRGVVIVQAAERSGSLATAGFALDAGRDLFVAPGAPFDRRYGGSLALLRSGAALLTSAADIFEAYPDIAAPQSCAPAQGERAAAETVALEERLLAKLQDGIAVPYDELARGFEPGALERALLALEMRGAVLRLPGDRLQLRPGH